MTGWTEDRLLGFDLEATGVNPLEDVPVSYSMNYYQNWTQLKAASGLINPGRPIPEQATAIHGITDEMAQTKGRPLMDAVAGIISGLVMASDEGIPVVGMNLAYDLQMIDTLSRNSFGISLREHGWDGPVIDILVIDRHTDRYRKGGRKLVDLCKHYDVSNGSLHDAANDVDAAVAVLSRQVERYPELRAMDLDELFTQQRRWHREWAEGFSQYLASQGREPLDKSEFSWPLR